VDTAGSAIQTVVAVYTNNTLQSLVSVAAAAGGNPRPQAFVQFNAKSGVNYHIAVASDDKSKTGTIRLAILPMGIPDTNAPSLAILSPLGGTSTYSNTALLSGTAIDPAPSASGVKELRFNVSPGLHAVPDFLSGETGYRMGASALSGSNWTQSIGLWVGVNNIRVTAVDFAGNVSAPQMLQMVYIPLDPINDTFVRGIPLNPTNAVVSGNTLNATKQPGEPNHADNAGGKSAWWTFTPGQDGVLHLSTTNSTFDTLLAVYTGSTVSNLTLVAQNDDAMSGVTFSELSAPVRSNVVYRIAVDGYDAAGGAMFLSYSFNAETIYRLTLFPADGGTTAPGSTDVFLNAVVSVSASPEEGYTFQRWTGTGDLVSVQNPLMLTVTGDMSLTPEFLPIVYSDGFESGNLSGLNWTNQGDLGWVVQSTNVAAGNYAARSGSIGNSQVSSLGLTGQFRAGNGSFSLNVSSEANFDFLKFVVDGTPVAQWSGEVGWTAYAFPLSTGTHTLEWRYVKDAAGTGGWDAAFIDNVDLPILVPVDASTPAVLTLVELYEGGYLVELEGQPNQQYDLQVSSDLISWTTLSSSVAVDGFAQFVDSSAPTDGAKFYRAVVPE
jgi:hypothetical protein